MANTWEKLAAFPFPCFSMPLLVNDTEFVVVPSKHTLCQSDGIYKFNTNTKEWTKILDYDLNFRDQLIVDTSAYNKDEELLYVFSGTYKYADIFTLNLKNNKLISSQNSAINSSHKMIYIDSRKELHQIGGTRSFGEQYGHFIWDKALEHFNRISEFNDLSGVSCRGHGLVYLDSKKCILLFGGEIQFITCTVEYSDSVHQFSIVHQKWVKLPVHIPQKLSNFALVKSYNERHVIILGGDKNGVDCDDIYVYDTNNMLFIQSNICCPKKGQFHAVIINDPKREEILTFGFVRDCQSIILSRDLIQLIQCWVSNQQIHLLETYGGNHWRINVDCIFNSL